MPTSEGHLDIGGRRTWYRTVGEPTDRPPLLLLHGGPGGGHADGNPFEATIARDRQIVMYDQLESGRSERRGDASALTVANYVAEVDAVRDALGLVRVHLWGQSWGGMLAMAYALTRPSGLLSVTNASGPFSTAQWIEAANAYRAALPPGIRRALARCEPSLRPTPLSSKPPPTASQLAIAARVMSAASNAALARPLGALGRALSFVAPLRASAYALVGLAFVRRHVVRLTPIPSGLTAGLATANTGVYQHLWGPSEFLATGVLRDWDLTDRLAELAVPMLITSGAHECLRPADVRQALGLLAEAEWVLFEQSAHCAEFEEPERYTAVLQAFLDRVDDAGVSRPDPPPS